MRSRPLQTHSLVRPGVIARARVAGLALFVALLAWPFGILGDRVGHKRVLFWATVVYGVFGTAPVSRSPSSSSPASLRRPRSRRRR